MDAIPALLSSVFGKIEPMFAVPIPDASRRRVVAASLRRPRSPVQAGHKAVVLSTFTELKILPILAALAIGDKPPHFVDVFLPFLERHMVPPLVCLVTEEWFQSVNSVLGYGARPRRSCLARFLHQAILFVSARPAWIPVLLTGQAVSPFFRHASQMIPLLYQRMGALALQIAWHSAASRDFERYIVDHSAYIPNCVTSILECMLERTRDRGKFKFVREFSVSLVNGPSALRNAFVDESEQTVVVPFVVQLDSKAALENAIWLLAD
jgi:hypothetical protein